MTIKHPKTAVAVVLIMGWAGYEYGLDTTAYFIALWFGIAGLYSLIAKNLDSRK